MESLELTQSLKSEARRLGFDFAYATPAVTPDGYPALVRWIEDGFSGEMHYMAERIEAYRHPKFVMDGVKSLLVLGVNYFSSPAEDGIPGHGKIARYAWGEFDYHDFIHKKLKHFKAFCRGLDPENPIAVRGVVDTAPLLEREFAAMAGVGWHAKNTMIINREIGSWFFISALLVDRILDYDQSFNSTHCGTCTACLDACPTDAFIEAGKLDATKCISYLTIEHRSPIPMELRPQMGDWILGCDVCQDVCPWNRKAPVSEEPGFQPLPGNNPIELTELFSLDDEAFRARFRKTPLWRPKRRGILRNAAIALGNRPVESNLPSLAKGLNDVEPLVRGACAWALGRHCFVESEQALNLRLKVESDESVQTEIDRALLQLGN